MLYYLKYVHGRKTVLVTTNKKHAERVRAGLKQGGYTVSKIYTRKSSLEVVGFSDIQ